MHEVTAEGDLFVLVKDGFGDTCYLDGIHMMYLAPYCLAFQVWYARPIDVLSHYDILLQDWKVFQDVITNCMEDFLYRLTSDVLESPYTIIPFYIAGGVYFLLVMQLWYGVSKSFTKMCAPLFFRRCLIS